MSTENNAELITEQIKLLPCPFCGSDDIDGNFALNGDKTTSPGCMACGGCCETVEAWNRRAPQQPAQGQSNEREEFESWWTQMPETSAFELSVGEDTAYNDTDVQRCWISWQARADRALRVPDGWVMVPREPTPEMRVAGGLEVRKTFEMTNTFSLRVYKAMIETAPKQGEQT